MYPVQGPHIAEACCGRKDVEGDGLASIGDKTMVLPDSCKGSFTARRQVVLFTSTNLTTTISCMFLIDRSRMTFVPISSTPQPAIALSNTSFKALHNAYAHWIFSTPCTHNAMPSFACL
jgi:hypothetical protein